jgi:hypothetical protein
MPHNCALFQMTDATKDSAPAATWAVTGTWDGPFADLALVEAVPDNRFAHDMLEKMQHGVVEWSLLPPPAGAQVMLFGVPEATLVVSETSWDFRGPFSYLTSEVIDVCALLHDRGFLAFPGFFVRGTVGHGFSGGPVFWNGRLCGVVSAVLGENTYVASLWPFGLMEIKRAGHTERVADWFDERRIRTADWPDIKNRMSLRVEPGGRYFAYIDPASG